MFWFYNMEYVFGPPRNGETIALITNFRNLVNSFDYQAQVVDKCVQT